MTIHEASSGARITLLTKPGCHLCDVARGVIEQVAAECDTDWTERDITGSREADLYWDKIPVTLVDGNEHAFWRVAPQRLRSALSR